VLDNIIMLDPGWTWVLEEWRAAGTHAELISRIDAHRAAIAHELAALLETGYDQSDIMTSRTWRGTGHKAL
jgi:hypothetical protein